MYARKTFLIIGSTIVTQVLGFISLFFITNNISKDDVGMVALVIGLLSLFGVIIDLGFSSAHIKRLSEGMDLGKCLGTYAAIKIVLLVIYVPFALVGIRVFSGYSDVDDRIVLLILSWSVLSTLTTIISNTYMGRQEMVKAQTIVVVSTVLQTLFTIVVVLVSSDVYLYASTWIVGAASGLAVALIMMNGFRVSWPRWEYVRSYTRYALPMMFVIGAAPIILQLNPVMIGFFGSKADVANFSIAVRYATAPEFISNSLIVVLFPAFSMMTATGRLDRIKAVTRNAEKYLSMVLVPPTFLVLAIATPFIVIVTDASYVASGIILSYLMAWVFIKSMSKPFLVHFGGMDRPIYSSMVSMVTLPVSVVLNLIFIPSSLLGVPLIGLGAKGAAIAAVIGAIISYIIVRALSYKLVPMGINKSVVKFLIAGTVMTISVFLMEHFLYGIERWYDLIIYTIIGGGIYLTIIWVMGEFRKADLMFFMDTMNVRKMYDYLSGELRNKKVRP